ncbi:MAG: GNAT family N-acetyltransferase [Actinomycetes bacterium]
MSADLTPAATPAAPVALVTDRLLLLPLTRAAMAARVELESLSAEHVLVGVLLPTDLSRADAAGRLSRDETWQRQDLLLPLSWPGDPLPMFPDRIAAMTDDDAEASSSWIVIPRDTLGGGGAGVGGSEADGPPMAVGLIGTVGHPTPDGFQEIGYGMNPEVWGRGYATEAVGAVVRELLRRPDVSIITADTAVGNVASQRVLEHNGFRQVGTDWSEDDGDLLVWQRLEDPQQ